MTNRTFDAATWLAMGQRDARLEKLFVDHYAWVWRMLRRFGVDLARIDDALQQVFLVASTRLAGVAVGSERAFLMAVILRVSSNVRRARERERRAEQDVGTLASAAPSPEQLLDLKQRRELLDQWLDELDLELRAPFVLYELEGLTLPEISELLALPLGTVKTRLRRARAAFLALAAPSGRNHG